MHVERKGIGAAAVVLAMLLAGGAIEPASAQNIVGYINIPVYAGDNLIANQLDDGAGDLLNSVLTNGVLAGSTFTEFNPTTGQFMPVSVYNGTSWSINYTFGPNGTGGDLHSPGSATVTTVGSVLYYNLSTQTFTYVPPNRSPGLYLLADAPPRPASTFADIIGRAPVNGDFVETLNGATQTYAIDTFENGVWDHGAPSLQPGQAAYFRLEVPVPEPSTLALVGAGAVLVAGWRQWRRK